MKVLTHWNPLREIHDLQHRVFNALGNTSAGESEARTTVAEWVPVVDIIEDAKEYLVKAELPGVTRENVHVTVENGRLAIKGERHFEKEEEGKKYHRVERSYGSFLRSFNLPENADAEKVEAEFIGGQETAIHMFAMLGFSELWRKENYVKDMQAISHDYVLMGLDLTTDEEYAGVGG